MFNIGYGCRIVLSFNFRTSLHLLILLECGLFTRTVGNPHCAILAGRIESDSFSFSWYIIYLCLYGQDYGFIRIGLIFGTVSISYSITDVLPSSIKLLAKHISYLFIMRINCSFCSSEVSESEVNLFYSRVQLIVVCLLSILFTMVSKNLLVLVFTVGCFITHISFTKFKFADNFFNKSHPIIIEI